MKENFKPSLALILQSEGGNDDDPQDHGGRTSRGITQNEYNAWLREHGRPAADVFTATQADIEDIYYSEYWQPDCNDLPPGVDYIYFDMKVNGGPHRAAVLLQEAVGVIADGRIGPISRAAIRSTDPIALITRYSDRKAEFYRALHQPRFLRGWLNRTAFVKENALKMVKGNG